MFSWLDHKTRYDSHKLLLKVLGLVYHTLEFHGVVLTLLDQLIEKKVSINKINNFWKILTLYRFKHVQ